MPSQSSVISPSSTPNPDAPDGYKEPLSFEQVQTAEDAALGGGRIQRTALCISGGGIRSATFALGAIQELAELGILENFDYLSTVSGGGYIGGWLTAWKQRRNGLKNIIDKLKSSAQLVPPGAIDPVQHLREYSNYLSPKLGLFSADTWTLAATIGRNMLLNWLVFIPLLLFGLMLPRILLRVAWLGEIYGYEPKVEVVGTPAFAIAAGLLFAIGVFNVLRYLPSVGNKDHTETQFLKCCLSPIFLAAVTVFIMEAWFTGGDTHRHELPEIGFWGWFRGIAIAGGAGWGGYLIFDLRSMWKKWRLITGLSVALLLTVLSLAAAAWALSQYFSSTSWSVYVTIALPLFLLALALAVTLFVGFTSNVLSDEDREWLSRAGAWILLSILVWVTFCGLVLLAPLWAFRISAKAESALAAAGGLSGGIAALAGLRTKPKGQQGAREGNTPAQAEKKEMLLNVLAKLAAPVFIVVFLTSLVLLTSAILRSTGLVHEPWREHQHFLEHTPARISTALALIFLIFSWIMARYININKFSLQAMYRSRLIRAYLGASNDQRHTNPFTGFADNDNLEMAKLTPTLKPFHVVNITLNLVSGERLAWQQRKAESFTVSALHCGYGDYYRPVGGYAGAISLGTAVAISGAAASPNMGYHSSPDLAFVMTLFNARMGAWLGNPKQKKWREQGPRSAFDSIVREAFSLTNDSSPYVYLSDGGHFENLGLYEMVRRRCRYIVVLDGGADPKFNYDDLGNALRKIRIDMKVTVEFEEPFLRPLETPKYRCAVAGIHYPEGLKGELVYVKPAVLGTEPADVTAYKAANADFPHQSTGDQWFDESQTESYRMLGLRSISEIFQAWDRTRGFAGVIDDARDYLKHRTGASAVAASASS